MRQLTEVQERILQCLADYRLLSVKQLIAAGAGRDRHHVQEMVRELHRHKLVRTLPDVNRKGEAAKVRFTPGIGRQGLLYYLTPAGAEIFAAITRRPPPQVREKGYKVHPKVAEWEAITDVRIALDKWAAAASVTVEYFQADFEPGATKFGQATRMPFVDVELDEPEKGEYIPDAVAIIRHADESITLIVLEVYMGGWLSRLDHYTTKVRKLAQVANLGVPEDHFTLTHYGRAARYLIVFKTPEMRQDALSRWPDRTWPCCDRFFIKSLDEVGASFNGDWWQPNGARRALFREVPA